MPAPIPPNAAIIAIAEGAATALSVQKATGWPVIAALSAGNLEAIAHQVRRDHPGASIVVCADLTKDTRQPDPHAILAAEAVGGRLAVPGLSSEEGTDWNDHQVVHGLAATRAEREAARLAPRCIVSRHTYADVATVSGAGGTGKTTHMLWEAIHIIIRRRLYGLDIEQPGAVIFITAEDARNVLLARLHRVMQDMDPPLTEAEIDAVEAGFIVWDASGDLSRLVDIDAAGRIMPTGFADAIIEAVRAVAGSASAATFSR